LLAVRPVAMLDHGYHSAVEFHAALAHLYVNPDRYDAYHPCHPEAVVEPENP
jgi:hypothetical protein